MLIKPSVGRMYHAGSIFSEGVLGKIIDGSLLFDSGCFPQPGCKVNPIRCLSGKALVGSVLIIGVEISPQPSSEFSDRVVGVEVNMLGLDQSPKPFDKHVVHPSALVLTP